MRLSYIYIVPLLYPWQIIVEKGVASLLDHYPYLFSITGISLSCLTWLYAPLMSTNSHSFLLFGYWIEVSLILCITLHTLSWHCLPFVKPAYSIVVSKIPLSREISLIIFSASLKKTGRTPIGLMSSIVSMFVELILENSASLELYIYAGITPFRIINVILCAIMLFIGVFSVMVYPLPCFKKC